MHKKKYESLKVSQDGAIGFIQIDRPEKRNALSLIMMKDLRRALEDFDPSVSVVILHGSGGNFSAGADLGEFADGFGEDSEDSNENSNTIEEVMEMSVWRDTLNAIRFGTRPIIAALEGAVIGGGLETAVAAHIRVADETAFFSLPEGARGVYPGGGASRTIARLIGADLTTDLILTGRRLNADEAERHSLVQYKTEVGGALEKARELAIKVSENLPLTNYFAIQLPIRLEQQTFDNGVFFEDIAASMPWSTKESNERVIEFLTKNRRRKNT